MGERVSLEHQNGVNQLSLISRNGRKLGRNQQISAELWSIVGVGSSGHRLNLSTECGTNETVQGHTLGGQIHGRSQFHLHSAGPQFLKLGVLVSLFAPLALSCELMALRGLRTWRKALLLPWLVLYAILVALVMSVVLPGTFHSGFHWRYLLLGLCCLCFFSAWRQVRLQYSAMSLPRPTCCTVQDLAEDLRQREAADVTSGPLPNDLPPKYDDLEQPPQYEEHL